MAHLLHREFIQQWQQHHSNDTIAYRDVGRDPIPHVDEAWIAAAFSPPEQYTPQLQEAIRLSDQLVDEFLAADIYVIRKLGRNPVLRQAQEHLLGRLYKESARM